jgi:hypothetical protein
VEGDRGESGKKRSVTGGESGIGKGGPREVDRPVLPAPTPSSERSKLIGDHPTVKTPSSERSKRSRGPEIDPIGLGGKEVPALLIPDDDFGPITEIKFDQYKLWKYEIRQFDQGRLYLVEKFADLNHKRNPVATDYVKRHSDAAKNPDSRLDSPKDLYAPVIVLAYDQLFEMITDLTTQLTKLKNALELMDPFRKTN